MVGPSYPGCLMSSNRESPIEHALDWSHTQLPSSSSGSAAVGSMAEPTPPVLPSELPVLPLRRTVAFPLTLQPLAVNRPVSIESVNRALGSDRLVLLLLQHSEADDPHPEDGHPVRPVGILPPMPKPRPGPNLTTQGLPPPPPDPLPPPAPP